MKAEDIRIDVHLKINQDAWAPGVMEQDHKETTLATAWVELGNFIRFPVSMKKFRDRESNKMQWFISYPQRKKGDKYESMVYPSDPDLKQRIETALFEEFRRKIAPSIKRIPATNIHVSLLDEEKAEGTVINRGVASIELGGITINGIMIKEGKNGLFVQMPQYRSTDGWKDSIYAIDRENQRDIQYQVLSAYGEEWMIKEYGLEQQSELWDMKLERAVFMIATGTPPEKVKPVKLPTASDALEAVQSDMAQETKIEEQPEEKEINVEQQTEREKEIEPDQETVTQAAPELISASEAVEMFLAAYDAGDREAFMIVPQVAPLTYSEPFFTDDQSTLILQMADVSDGKYKIRLVFENEYEPNRPWKEGKAIHMNIRGVIESNRHSMGQYNYMDMACNTKEEAEQSYATLFEFWKNLTHQDDLRPVMPVPTETESVEPDPNQQQPRL